MAVIEQEQRNRIPILEQTQIIEQIVEKIKDFEQLKLVCHTIIDKIVITDENVDIHYKI